MRVDRLFSFIAGAAFGAVVLYFVDKHSGRRRRHTAVDQSLSLIRKTKRRTLRKGDYWAGRAVGMAHEFIPSPHARDVDDVTLAHKVESIIFREHDAPKGHVNIHAENGVIYLRGGVSQEWSDRLADRARAVDGVRGVKNLLHVVSS